MDKNLNFFNYEKCLVFYERRIETLNQARMHGEESIAKPVLLLAIIDAISFNEITTNQIQLNEKLIIRYERLMDTYAKGLTYYSKTTIANPFWHLQGDDFWHLNGAACIKTQKNTPSVPWIQEYVSYAYFDESLWVLLQNKEWRLQLREYIIEHKLTNGKWLGKLRTIAALLLAA